MLHQRKATVADVAAVLADVSDVTSQELETVSRTPWQTLKTVNTDELMKHAVAVYDDYIPLFVIGHSKTPGYKARRGTWFAASKAFFDGRPGRSIYLRKVWKQIVRQWPGYTFASQTWSKHPLAGRWLKLFGFE